MDRRETLKALMMGSAAGVTIATTGCRPGQDPVVETESQLGDYGRTPSEKEWDKQVMSYSYFTEHELGTIAALCDIILPATPTAGSAIDAGVPEFIEFIAKDLPQHQLPLRGGIMWLDGEAQQRYNNRFSFCTNEEQIAIIDDIAYPDEEGKKPLMGPGIKFFDHIRNLVLTGYYTTKIGIDDLGYRGNVPNMWDGIPEEVLAKHDVDYDPEWIKKCVDQDKREVIAEWDDKGNLIT